MRYVQHAEERFSRFASHRAQQLLRHAVSPVLRMSAMNGSLGPSSSILSK